MKTTVEISDPLFEEARSVAGQEGLTLRALIERGLRLALAQQSAKGAFRLRDARFRGRGLQHQYRDGQWHPVSSAIHDESPR